MRMRRVIMRGVRVVCVCVCVRARACSVTTLARIAGHRRAICLELTEVYSHSLTTATILTVHMRAQPHPPHMMTRLLFFVALIPAVNPSPVFPLRRGPGATTLHATG